MKEKVIKSVSKRIAAFGICLVSAASMIASAIPTAEAKASKDTLGTNTALGSPVLNHTNFTSEDWNEWETICWGVFLGNFCQPLIDNYESTFKEGHGGSNGHGFHALWGGSGSDLANKDVIKALTEYAIDKQAEIAEPIYVSYTKGNNIGLPLKKDEADIKTADVRTARFRDLFFYWEEQFSDGGGTATVEEPTDGASAGPVAATVGVTDDSSSETTEAATDEDGNPVEQDPTEATVETDENATNVGYSMPNGQNNWSYENGNLTPRDTTPGPSNRNSFQSATIYQGDRDEFIGDTLPAEDPEELTDPPAPGDENPEGATEATTSDGPSAAQNEAANKGITFAKFLNSTPQLNGAGDMNSSDAYNVISRDKFGNEYDDMLTASDYNLPTFYVRRIFGENSYDQLYKSHNEYITILDYTDWWDVQIMSMLLNALRDDEELGSSVLDDSTVASTETDAEQQDEEGNPVDAVVDSMVTTGDKNNLNISSNALKKAFQKLWTENPGIQLDTFGNIVVKSGDTEGVMVMPAALNQNVTGERKINTLNSWILNNMRGGVTDQTLRLSACQMGNSTGNALEDTIKDAGTSWFGINNQYKLNGMPALASSGVGYTGIFYYDLDSFMVKYARELEAGKRQPEDVLYGNALLELFDTKLDSDFTSPNAPLKFELMNVSDKFSKTEFAVSKEGEANVSDVLQSQMLAASCLPNILFDYDAGESGQKRLLHNLLTPSGEAKVVYTNKPSVLAVRLDPIKVNARDIDASQQGIAAVRLFYSWLYDKYNIKSETATYNRNSVLATLKDKNFDSFYKSVGSGKSEFSMFNGFLKDVNKYGDADVGHEDYSDNTNWNPNQNHAFSKENSRVVLAYKGSKEQEFLASCTAIKEGAEFDLYCTYLYMTYLDFYGVNSSATVKTGVHNSSDFDSLIYATDLRKGNLIEDIAKELYDYDTNLADKIDVEDEVLQMSYMMLNPDNAAARDYRRKLANNTITDFLYEQYNRMVYGRSTNYSGTASSSRSGFLSIETYADNVFTKPFLDNYVVIAVWLIMGSVLFILIVGLIKKKKASWFFITTVVAINSFVIAPTSGEIVPYVTSAATTRLFYDKMTFWSISQGITNAEIERSARVNEKSFRDIEDSDATVLLSLANSLLSLHTDSSLCVKQDISQKVTQTAEGVYKDIESYASAQWIIPMVMQQFSSNTSENLENFIYKPLANIWTDLSNVYWYFEPSDAELTDSMSKTYTSGQITDNCAERTGEDGSGEFAIFKRINKYYPDFVDPDNQPNVYTGPDGKFWNCRSYSTYIRNPKESAHVVLPYLDSSFLQLSIPSRATTISNYKDADSWGDYIRTAVNSNSGVTYYNWLVCDPDAQGRSTSTRMADTADSYDRYDRDTITPDMPYLLSTESPIYYMYAIVKDSFQSDASYGRLVRDIQGTVKEAEQNNETKPVFFSFMYATKSSTENGEAAQSTATSEINSDSPLEATGYVRDVLDLQEMFTNIIPYMYQMSISACGFTGTDGILGDARITKDLNYYEGELQSWMYRCNWATKIMENPAYSEPVTVRDANGQVYDVANPLLPECYPKNRPMVFSEAQREAMGLKDKDLSQVELKCIKLNKDTVREWQLLLNYVVTDGMTKEIMMRQMATDATLLFCNTFGNIGVLDNKYTMYPTSLDLRYLSFDAIMRILMLNVSSNTNYASGDAMLNVLSNSDMVTGVLLLLAAFFGAFLMPFFRTLLMAVIFYLGFWAIINTIVATRERKVNVVCGQVVSNIIFMVYTLAYYGVYYLLMKVTNPAEGLHVHSVSTNTGSPAWMIFIVLVINIVYVAILGKHIIFCVKNRNDMGYAAYSQMANSIVSSISEIGGKAGTAISNVFNGFGDFSHNEHNQHVGNTQSISGSGFGFGAFGGAGGSQGRSGDTTTNIGGDSIEVNTVNNKNTSSKVDLGLVESDYNIQDSGPSNRGDRDSKTEIYTTPDDINNTIASGGKEIKKDDTFVDVDFNNSIH